MVFAFFIVMTLTGREAPTETIDILNYQGGKTGKTILRDEAHRTGAWHGAFHCCVLYTRDSRDCVLFQKRSHEKKIAPGQFDVSVGGHYASGEDAKTAGPREIKEELGLDVRFEELVPVGRRVFVYGLVPGVREHEFQDIFLLQRTLEPGQLALQREELDGVLELDVDSGIKLFSGKEPRVRGCFYPTDGSSAEQLQIATADFVSCLDNYYLKLFLLVRRYLNGERELLVI
jgi:isopentenyldiphosphate isomerase